MGGRTRNAPSRVTWNGLTAHYSTRELAVMAQLRKAGEMGALRLIHECKALLGARII